MAGIDATLNTAVSAKQSAAATYKRGFGFCLSPVGVRNISELTAMRLPPGNIGSNTAGTDDLGVLTAANAQIPRFSGSGRPSGGTGPEPATSAPNTSPA